MESGGLILLTILLTLWRPPLSIALLSSEPLSPLQRPAGSPAAVLALAAAAAALAACRLGVGDVALRELDGEQGFVGRWLLVDILDISKGGMCLMVSDAHHFLADQHLMLDLRAHPDFGVLRLEVKVRWCRCSRSFTTFGVSFLEALPVVPRLEMERRSERRDPNDQPWAQE